MQEWEGVGEFAAVAETLSFTRAAARLGISTAQVSRRVSALEARLGVKLLQRTTRSVSMTEQGETYYAHIRRVLDGLAEAERAVTQANAAPAGRLSLTAPVTFGESVIGPLVNEFLTRHPALEVTLTLTNQKIDLVAEGYDLAIRLGTLQDSSLIATRLAARTLHVCASPAYLASRGTPQQPGDLSRHNCLQGTLDHWRFRQNGRRDSCGFTAACGATAAGACSTRPSKGWGWCNCRTTTCAPPWPNRSSCRFWKSSSRRKKASGRCIRRTGIYHPRSGYCWISWPSILADPVERLAAPGVAQGTMTRLTAQPDALPPSGSCPSTMVPSACRSSPSRVTEAR